MKQTYLVSVSLGPLAGGWAQWFGNKRTAYRFARAQIRGASPGAESGVICPGDDEPSFRWRVDDNGKVIASHQKGVQ
jgi:hypothetical protein